MNDFGTRVRQWRTRAGLSQRQLATACGFSQPALSDIESGATKPATLRADSLIRMARVLQVSAEELYTGRAPCIEIKTGEPQENVLQLLNRMSPQSIEAWLENGVTIIRHQGPVSLADRGKNLHTTDAPKNKNGIPRMGITTESELVAVHGREEANRIIAEEVARDDARQESLFADTEKRTGKQPRRDRDAKAE